MADARVANSAQRGVMIGLILAAAFAAKGDIAPIMPDVVFKGVFVTTYPDGRYAKLWLERDGSYRAEGRRRDKSSGVWSIKSAKTCLRQSKPIPVPFSFCAAMTSDPEQAWSAKALSGESVQVRLVPGR